jgi:hypothetical protein
MPPLARLLGFTGANLLRDLGIREEDLTAVCTHLAGESLIVTDRASDNTPP